MSTNISLINLKHICLLSFWVISVGCSPESSSNGATVIIPDLDGMIVADANENGPLDAGVSPDGNTLHPVDATVEPDALLAVERRVLHEVFSGSNCGPCLGSAERISEILEARPQRHSVIKYQIGSDPYLSAEAIRRRMFYLPGAENYSIPYVHADGVNEFHPNEVNDDQGYLMADFDRFASVPTELALSVHHTLEGQTLQIEVDMTPLADYTSEHLRLFIAIVENVTYNNVGSNGQTEFHGVFKKMLPDENGIALEPLRAGIPLQVSRTYTFQGDYAHGTGIRNPVNHNNQHTVEEFVDLSVVAFVQDVNTWQVHQSATDAPVSPRPQGSVEGRLSAEDGSPMAHRPITCCDATECLAGMTDAEGHYRFEELTYNHRKIELIAPDGFADLIFTQEVGAWIDAADVIIPAIDEERSPWSVAGGGPVSLAHGALVLTAAPGTLNFGIAVDASLVATQVDFGLLAPYLPAADAPGPWALETAVGTAFIINPIKIMASSPVAVSINEAVAGLPVAEAGTQYDLYAVDPDTAIAGHVGMATRDEMGYINSAPDGTLTKFSALIIVQK